MAVVPSAFVCGAAWARAMWLFTVFVLVSVIGKLLRFGLVIARLGRTPVRGGARFRLTFVTPEPPAASRQLSFFYSAVV